ncbi:MAG: YeeE/YedE thiosulfate transporter family protein [Saprospiraceae bacterium]
MDTFLVVYDQLNHWISQPWHWSVSGLLFGVIVLVLTLMGKMFGISASFRDMCSAVGLGKKIKALEMPGNSDYWRLYLVAGVVMGSFLATSLLSSDMPVQISNSTIASLEKLGFSYPENGYNSDGFILNEVFNLSNPYGIFLALLGGFLVGFGSRYAGGCTSGHAITGLSHLKLPSLITVIGFFIGGLLMTHFLLEPLLTFNSF